MHVAQLENGRTRSHRVEREGISKGASSSTSCCVPSVLALAEPDGCARMSPTWRAAAVVTREYAIQHKATTPEGGDLNADASAGMLPPRCPRNIALPLWMRTEAAPPVLHGDGCAAGHASDGG
jgi:hypothetical protein